MGLNLNAKVSLDGSGFESGLRKMEGAVSHFGLHMVGIVGAAFSLGAIEETLRGLTERTIEFADRMADTSKRLGVGVEFLQGFEYAAKQAGASVEDLVGVIEKINANRIEALTGKAGNAQIQSFGRLGVSEGDLRSKRSDELLLQIGAAFKSGSTDSLIGAFKEIGGRGAGALVGAFKDGLAEKIEESKSAGAIIAAEQIAVIKALKDQLTALTQVITAQTAPAIIGVLRNIVEMGFGLKTAFSFLQAGLKGVKGGDIVSGLTGNPIALIKMLTGFDPKAAGEAAKSSADDASKFFEKVNEKIKELSKNLNEPERTDFSSLKHEAAPVKSGARQSDSLVSIGNFLGSSSSAIERIGERTNTLLYSIDQRLARMTTGNSDSGFPATA